MCWLYEAHSSAPDIPKNINMAAGQFMDKVFGDDMNAVDATIDKFARCVNHVAKKSMFLIATLEQKHTTSRCLWMMMNKSPE